jgi:hypothetical protein
MFSKITFVLALACLAFPTQTLRCYTHDCIAVESFTNKTYAATIPKNQTCSDTYNAPSEHSKDCDKEHEKYANEIGNRPVFQYCAKATIEVVGEGATRRWACAGPDICQEEGYTRNETEVNLREGTKKFIVKIHCCKGDNCNAASAHTPAWLFMMVHLAFIMY